MLKPDGQLEKTPNRGRGRWALPLLVPPIVLLGLAIWALPGAHVALGPHHIETMWWRGVSSTPQCFIDSGPFPLDPRDGTMIDGHCVEFHVGTSMFVIGYAQAPSQPRR